MFVFAIVFEHAKAKLNQFYRDGDWRRIVPEDVIYMSSDCRCMRSVCIQAGPDTCKALLAMLFDIFWVGPNACRSLPNLCSIQCLQFPKQSSNVDVPRQGSQGRDAPPSFHVFLAALTAYALKQGSNLLEVIVIGVVQAKFGGPPKPN